jgi:Zn-dependent peptidase ImmA (M78 family)
MKQKLGELVRTQRSLVGLKLDDVAEQARVPAETLAAFEGGLQNITAAALDRISYVLAIDPRALREGRIERRPTASLFFRQGAFPDFREVEDRPSVAAAFDRALALVEINAILGRPPSLRARFEPEEPTPEAAMDGYRLASRVRGTLGNETDPVPDMAPLLEDQLDILVRVEPLASRRIDALSLKEAQTGAAAVILNATSERRANPNTARVDLAHELAHILFDPANGEINIIVDDESDEDRSVTHAERRARAFSAELLMPLEGLRRLLGRPRYEMSAPRALDLVDRVRQEFVTPIEITVSHLVNREYIVHWLREPLIEKARRVEPPRGLDLSRPALVHANDVLERRVLEALAHGWGGGGWVAGLPREP